MNQTFDLSRFNNYFAYFLKTGIRRHAAIVGALLGATLLMVILPELMFDAFEWEYTFQFEERGITPLFSPGEDPMWSTEYAIFVGMFILIMIISASAMFSDFSNKASRLDALMLPASSLEKYLTRWIIYVPLTAVVCFFAFELIDVVRYIVVVAKYGAIEHVHLAGMRIFTDAFFAYLMPVMFFNMFVAVFALGAIVWPRLSVVKTFGVICLLQTVYSWWTIIMSAMIIHGYYRYNDDLLEVVVNVILAVVTLAIYVTAYYRLKEIELVQRW